MKSQLLTGLTVAVICLNFAGCRKKVIAATPRTPEPVAARANTTPEKSATPLTHAKPAEVAGTSPRLPDAATRARIQELLNRIQDAYFDYDKHTIRPDAEAALKHDAQTLSDIIRQYPDFKLMVAGYCDERGSDEYNIALGAARAKQAKEYIAGLGLPAAQLETTSYGKEYPVCTAHDEACWQKNRRAHITQAN